jgi:hypothetical protein
MIAKCVRRSIDSIPDIALRDHVRQYVHLSEVNLNIGESYRVFGVSFRDGIPWFLVCEEPDDNYPKPHCYAFFEIGDAKLDPNWGLSLSQTNVGKYALLPIEWASDPSFLEKLVDGNVQAVQRFRELKSLL